MGGGTFFNSCLTGMDSSFFGLGQTVAGHGAAACLPDVIILQALQVGDKVDIEGFLYWYEGPQPHITGIGVKAN